jgi:uncharacterized protein (DUF362 family)
MDKSDKTISRRDFIAVVGGAIVATELGAACGEAVAPEGDVLSTGPAGAAGTPAVAATTPVVPTNPATSQTPAVASTPTTPAVPTTPITPAVTPMNTATASTTPATSPTAPTTPTTPQSPATSPGTPGTTTPPPAANAANGKAKVIIIKAADRKDGIMQALTMFGGLGFAAGRDVIIKPNYNSTYEFPATTHNDTLSIVVEQLKAAMAGKITVGESAGATTFSAQPTVAVTEFKGTMDLVSKLGVEFVSFDETSVEWEEFTFDGMTWANGLKIPKLMRSDRVKILLPCCKTHTLADYTFSMKLAAGLPPRSRRGLVSDMHTDLQEKVVDINKGFTPDLILMDALKCFIDGGPDSGTEREPGLIVAATDRVALDAVGVAILKNAGSTSAPIRGKIFETRQMKRAVEIKLGISTPDDIELVGNDDATLKALRGILDVG